MGTGVFLPSGHSVQDSGSSAHTPVPPLPLCQNPRASRALAAPLGPASGGCGEQWDCPEWVAGPWPLAGWGGQGWPNLVSVGEEQDSDGDLQQEHQQQRHKELQRRWVSGTTTPTPCPLACGAFQGWGCKPKTDASSPGSIPGDQHMPLVLPHPPLCPRGSSLAPLTPGDAPRLHACVPVAGRQVEQCPRQGVGRTVMTLGVTAVRAARGGHHPFGKDQGEGTATRSLRSAPIQHRPCPLGSTPTIRAPPEA